MVEEDLDQLLAVHQEIRNALPNAWNPFFARFGRLRPVQIAAIPRVVRGANVLLTAPTAGGKTEAVAAPVCERLFSHSWKGLSVVIVTPTRALVNDLFLRLQRPVGEMGIAIGRKTSDHGISQDVREQLLITTPESLESLLTFRKESLRDVRAIIMDEIHLLDGTPRGDQLRFVVRRLDAYCQATGAFSTIGLQRVAISATVGNPAKVANVYLGLGGEIISVPGQRDIEARVTVGSSDDHIRAQCAIASASEIGDVQKLLVFVNSRKQVDEGTASFRCGLFGHANVYGHHGNLSKEERERVEEKFRGDRRAVCVTTMTLEVGIDIGDVDLVVCLDPPFSLSSFLQRIGRGCRRLNGRTRVVCVARNRAGEIIFNALIHQSRRGMPRGPLVPLRRSVLVQQIMAYLRQAPKRHRTLSQLNRVLASDARPCVPESMVLDVLNSMLASGLLVVRNEIYAPAQEGWGFIESNQIYTNIAPSLESIALVDADTGRSIATVKTLGDNTGSVKIAGQDFSVLKGGSKSRHLVRLEGEAAGAPEYHARILPYAFDVGASLLNYLGLPAEKLVLLPAERSVVIMTWLGRLFNTAIAHTLKRSGIIAQPRSFSVVIKDVVPERALELVAGSVDAMKEHNPLGSTKLERIVDLGPHRDWLSDQTLKRAREDWLDHDFLNEWISRIEDVMVLSPGDKLFSDVSEVARL